MPWRWRRGLATSAGSRAGASQPAKMDGFTDRVLTGSGALGASWSDGSVVTADLLTQLTQKPEILRTQKGDLSCDSGHLWLQSRGGGGSIDPSRHIKNPLDKTDYNRLQLITPSWIMMIHEGTPLSATQVAHLGLLGSGRRSTAREPLAWGDRAGRNGMVHGPEEETGERHLGGCSSPLSSGEWRV